MSQAWPIPGIAERDVRSRELLSRRLETAKAEAQGPANELLLVRVEAPVVSPEAFLERFSGLDCVSWHPSDGSFEVGLGVAHSIGGRGSARFQEVLAASAKLWARVRMAGSARADADGPRLFGGFAFADDGAREGAWPAFGSARFVLPRVTYSAQRDRAHLTLAIERAELERQLESPSVELFQRAHQVLLDSPTLSASRLAEPLDQHEPDAQAFERRVEQLIALIRDNQLSKVVTARQVQFACRAPLDTVGTLAALREQASGCERFLFRVGDTSFIGATPERLLRKRGLMLETEALAGSIDATSESPERRLRDSSKELEEHELVVAAIQRALVPLCGKIQAESTPTVRHLKHIMHLCTPIRARLERDTHVIDLVERLHPTPAVGGVPTDRAMAWITRHEAFDRGWYSGAVGWFDAKGDGDFNVALRSGLLRDRTAWLYAGAGIVQGSVARAEFAETTLKLSALRSSLRTRL